MLHLNVALNDDTIICSKLYQRNEIKYIFKILKFYTNKKCFKLQCFTLWDSKCILIIKSDVILNKQNFNSCIFLFKK